MYRRHSKSARLRPSPEMRRPSPPTPLPGGEGRQGIAERRPRFDPFLVAILLGSLVLNTHRIGHPGLHYWDESFHAIVARNLLKHPFEPTLVDTPYLPYDPSHWSETRVWLHKPILPLWTIAASFAVLGVNTTALRLPSALLATASVALTFLIGRRLFDRRVGLIASALQAINPAIAMLVQGYLFSDHVDVSLLFWVEVGIYFLIRAVDSVAWPDVLLSGVAQGLAFLSKSYLAALLTGLAITVWLLPKVGLVGASGSRLRFRHFLGLVAATLATAAPWMIHCARSFPVEFAHEHGYVFTHLGRGVENWGSPWDRLYFDYLPFLHRGFYVPMIVAGLMSIGPTWRELRVADWLVFAWLFGVLVPHTFAATKTPSATLIALPAGSLLLARWIADGWSGRLPVLASWAAVAVVEWARPAPIGRFGRGFPEGGVMLRNLWVFEHLALGAGLGLMFWWLSRFRRSSSPLLPGAGPGVWDAAPTSRSEDGPGSSPTGGFHAPHPRPLSRGERGENQDPGPLRWLRPLALASTLFVAARVAQAAWRVTEGSEARPFVAEMARAVGGGLPERAVLLFDGPDQGDHQVAMFLLDRTCYPLKGRSADDLARRVVEAGGIPFVVTDEDHPWPIRFAGAGDGRTLREWREPAVATGPAPPTR